MTMEQSKNESQHPDENKKEPTSFDKLLESPDIQKSISRIPDLISENIQAKRDLAQSQIDAQVKVANSMTKWTCILVGILAFVVVIAICWLAISDKISSDAVSVVLGAIIGSSFTYIAKVFKRD